MTSSTCPYCFVKLDRSIPGDLSDRTPQPGDVTICVYCLATLEYTEELGLKPVTDETLIEIAGAPSFKAVNEVAQELSVRRWSKGQGKDRPAARLTSKALRSVSG